MVWERKHEQLSAVLLPENGSTRFFGACRSLEYLLDLRVAMPALNCLLLSIPLGLRGARGSMFYLGVNSAEPQSVCTKGVLWKSSTVEKEGWEDKIMCCL